MSQRTRSDVVPTAPPANGPPSSERAPATPGRDPVSPFAHDVLALFHGALAEVRFPDVDRATLESLAAAARGAQAEVEAVEAALEVARTRTLDAQATLNDVAARALAYARVYASGQPAVEDAVSAVRAAAPRGPLARSTASARELPASEDGASQAATLPEGARRRRARRDATTSDLLPMTMGEAVAT